MIHQGFTDTGYTLQEIADELGVTVTRVKQIQSEAIKKISRDPRTLDLLREYWRWSTERRQAEGFVAREGLRI